MLLLVGQPLGVSGATLWFTGDAGRCVCNRHLVNIRRIQKRIVLVRNWVAGDNHLPAGGSAMKNVKDQSVTTGAAILKRPLIEAPALGSRRPKAPPEADGSLPTAREE